MRLVLLLAGGVGSRFGADIPKQFVKVNEKPILCYTLSSLQQSESVDEIAVVCVADWEDEVTRIKNEYGFTKLKHVIHGGETRFGSIYNGIRYFKGKLRENDIVMIHDSVRPCLTEAIIEDSFAVAEEQGAALAAAPCFDTMFISPDGSSIEGIYPREKLFKGQTPESMRYGVALEAYEEADGNGIRIDSPTTLLMELGRPIALSKGSQGNIKVTTKEDVILFKSILDRMDQK